MINLLPPAIKNDRKFGRINRLLVGVSSSILLLALLCAGIMFYSYLSIDSEENTLKKDIAAKQTEINNLEDSQKQIDQVAKQLDTIKKLQADEVNFSEIIPQIGGIIPPGAILTSLSLTGNKDQPLQLSFEMKSQELAAVIRENLVNSPLFESADITNVSNSSSDDPATDSAYSFSTSITVSFEGASKKPAAKPAATGESQ